MLKPHDKHEQTVIKRAGRKHAEDDHGGAWKVAFADFCLALLALFLVLWLMATREQQKLKDEVRELSGQLGEGRDRMVEIPGGPRGSLIERFTLPRTASADKVRGEAGPSGSPRPKASYQTPAELAELSRALVAMSSEAGLSANLEAIVTPNGLRVMLHDTEQEGMFVRSGTAPSERFRRLLRKMGPLFAQMENQMLIVGHTDSLQYADAGRTGYSNWNLSSNRAMAARAQLLAGSMNPDSVLQVVGMADRAPLDARNAQAGVNRRIELLILTRDQADLVSAMFGKAGPTLPLIDGVDTSVPREPALKQLRDKLGGAADKAPAPGQAG